jgi:hypothetical protein
MKVSPDKKKDPESQATVWDWWGPCKKLMNGGSFRNDLMSYPKEEITEEMIKKMTPYIE